MLLYHFVDNQPIGLSDCILLILVLFAYVNYHPLNAGTSTAADGIGHPNYDSLLATTPMRQQTWYNLSHLLL